MLSRHSVFRIEIASSLNHREYLLQRQIASIGIGLIKAPRISDLYFIAGDIDLDTARTIAEMLILDPVTESFTADQLPDRVDEVNGASHNIEVTFRPGVTDNIAVQLLEAAKRHGIQGLSGAATGTRYQFDSTIPIMQLSAIAKSLLVNDTIQRFSFRKIHPVFIGSSDSAADQIERIPITAATPSALAAISADRRLALSEEEMAAIQAHYQVQGRDPTDAELETLAQTWSEHCVHKTFKGSITLQSGDSIDGLIYHYLKAATDAIDAPWVRSAFVDNAGVIAFTETQDLSFKVETHNHPSAIEPFGGANTGVGGVVRDVLGVSHRPIANTDVLCFGPQDMPFDQLPDGVLHPSRVQDGVVAGVGDYGNKLGLPTVNGAVVYHSGYTANPLVFCGSVGIGPRGSHPTAPSPGDRIILIGGKTGRDGLRGATFSSLTMDAQTGEVAGASVQIGDPITEKGLIEVVERARDEKLYTAITDCGAGGLSSAVGEMSSHLGASVQLADVPLKYAGLAPWEIWLSEAQERMVLAVPPENIARLQKICSRYWVELSVIGQFEETGLLRVMYSGDQVVNLENEFLHHGIPRRKLRAQIPESPGQYRRPNPKPDLTAGEYKHLLLSLLSHPNIASKEAVIRQYDHEVRGATVIKPFAGECQDGPSDSAVLKPLNTNGWRGFALGNGINPMIGEASPYYMALSVVDEAVRNLVAVGADPTQIALLDNFCWGDPDRPEILGSLVEAVRGCHDAAVKYQTPFISGKDSLNNEFVGRDGKRQAIPGTLLISGIGILPDIRRAVSMDLKTEGDILYLVGDWMPAFTGSHVLQAANPETANLLSQTAPCYLSDSNLPVYKALFAGTQAKWISSLHDVSEGGLSVALAEMCLAGRLGARIELNQVDESAFTACFAETNGCLIAAVHPEAAADFEHHFEGLPLRQIGEVLPGNQMTLLHGSEQVLEASIEEILASFSGNFNRGSHGS